MRRIPTAEQKEELKRLLKKQYEDTIASIDRDEGVDPAYVDWSFHPKLPYPLFIFAGMMRSTITKPSSM